MKRTLDVIDKCLSEMSHLCIFIATQDGRTGLTVGVSWSGMGYPVIKH